MIWPSKVTMALQGKTLLNHGLKQIYPAKSEMSPVYQIQTVYQFLKQQVYQIQTVYQFLKP